jgi:hypothetical protein
MWGISDPSLWTNFAPAWSIIRRCRLHRSCLQVVGVSFAAPSAFFKGENSSSLSTSHTAKLLSHLTQTQNKQQQGNQTTCQRTIVLQFCYSGNQAKVTKMPKTIFTQFCYRGNQAKVTNIQKTIVTQFCYSGNQEISNIHAKNII